MVAILSHWIKLPKVTLCLFFRLDAYPLCSCNTLLLVPTIALSSIFITSSLSLPLTVLHTKIVYMVIGKCNNWRKYWDPKYLCKSWTVLISTDMIQFLEYISLDWMKCQKKLCKIIALGLHPIATFFLNSFQVVLGIPREWLAANQSFFAFYRTYLFSPFMLQVAEVLSHYQCWDQQLCH